jgi:hypothetical protein
MLFRSFSRWLLLFCCTLTVLPANTIFDINTAFNGSNPNGSWTFREGNNVLPFVSSWIPGAFSGPQAAFAMAVSGTGHVPSWFISAATPVFANTDFQAGDVIVHSASPGVGAANVMWTSTVSGSADISGGLWMARNIGRANSFNLFLNNTLLAQGNVSDGDAFSRANQNSFTFNDMAINVGDVVRLEILRTSNAGDFVGVDLAIGVTEAPEPSIGILAVSGLLAFAGFARYRRRYSHR